MRSISKEARLKWLFLFFIITMALSSAILPANHVVAAPAKDSRVIFDGATAEVGDVLRLDGVDWLVSGISDSYLMLIGLDYINANWYAFAPSGVLYPDSNVRNALNKWYKSLEEGSVVRQYAVSANGLSGENSSPSGSSGEIDVFFAPSKSEISSNSVVMETLAKYRARQATSSAITSGFWTRTISEGQIFVFLPDLSMASMFRGHNELYYIRPAVWVNRGAASHSIKDIPLPGPLVFATPSPPLSTPHSVPTLTNAPASPTISPSNSVTPLPTPSVTATLTNSPTPLPTKVITTILTSSPTPLPTRIMTMILTKTPTPSSTPTPALSEFDGGVGSEEDPYLISTAKQLSNLRNYLEGEGSGKYWLITRDINLEGYHEDEWDSNGSGWAPIGDTASTFKGNLNGGGYAVSGLSISRDNVPIGLFGYISDGLVENLTLSIASNGVQTDVGNVGGLAGLASSTTFRGIKVKAPGSAYGVKGAKNVGGLVGYAQNSIFDNCEYTGKVCSTNTGTAKFHTGGLIGYSDHNQLNYCRSTGEVSTTVSNAPRNIGGLAGYLTGNTVSRSWTESTITVDGQSSSELMVGGLIGSVESASIYDCYAVGNLDSGSGAKAIAGGLVGSFAPLAASSSVINNCYAAVTINATGDDMGIGAIVGHTSNKYSVGMINACVYNTDLTNKRAVGNLSPVMGAFLMTSTEMRVFANFTTNLIRSEPGLTKALSWSNAIWASDVGSGRPFLKYVP